MNAHSGGAVWFRRYMFCLGIATVLATTFGRSFGHDRGGLRTHERSPDADPESVGMDVFAVDRRDGRRDLS